MFETFVPKHVMQSGILAIFIIFGTMFCEGQLIQDNFSADGPDIINYESNLSRIPADACHIDQLLENGWIEYANPPYTKLVSNDYVSSLTSVNYKCKENHFLEGPAVNVCFKGKWVITALPECRPYCSYTDISSASFVANNCFYKNVSVECLQPARPGTTAHINCREMYERDLGNLQVISCGDDGIWTPYPKQCTMLCGINTDEGSDGLWNILIHKISTRKYELAALISPRMALALANFFWDSEKKETRNLTDYWIDPTIDSHERFEVERISYAPNVNRFPVKIGDLAIVVMRTGIDFTPSSDMTPICLPFDQFPNDVIPSDGEVYGYGKVKLPVNCFSEWNSTSHSAPQLTNNNFCTNRFVDSEYRMAPGSAFVAAMKINGRTVFYFYGIMTNSYDDDEGSYYVFQNILRHKEFIQNEISNENDRYFKGGNNTISSLILINGGCRAANIPNRGNAYYESNLGKIEYGEVIPNLVGIVYRCIENNVLYGNSTNFCLDGKWIFSEPECKPRCNPMEIQGWTLVANCQFQEDNTLRQTSCTQPALPGTVASINCERGYQRYGSHQQTATCGADGRWSPLPEKCTAICGEISQGGAYVIGGQISEISKVPWHAAIFKQYRENHGLEQVCGGSILTAKVIVSAMHCFWDPSKDTIHNKNEYEVAVGKSQRQLNGHENLKPQFFKIENIFYEEGYSDYGGNYANDIAVLVLNKYIEFKSYITPVCIHFGLEYDDRIVEPGLIGKVAGWGLVQTNGEPSPTLKEIELPVISRKDCLKQSTKEFRQFITSDKFCAGYLTGVGVCRGDSGGGLVFPQTVGAKTVYFLRGIVSTGENKQGSCNNDKYSTFTNIAYYTDFLKKYYIQYQPIL